ncbi:MAG: hypothetical protein JO274_09150, partial [Gammaproteobacteria bacterium]|nr:hypothetical protein [Gammaproteobacteria bacterium]
MVSTHTTVEQPPETAADVAPTTVIPPMLPVPVAAPADAPASGVRRRTTTVLL